MEWLQTISRTPEHVQATIQAVVALFAIVGGWFTYAKYRKEQRLRRAEFFLRLRKELNGSAEFKKIAPLLHWDSIELRNVPREEKQYLLLFYEQVALLVNSGLMSKETAHYMFGYDIIRIARCTNFWVKDQLNNRWWELFKEFEVQMERLEPKEENRRWWLSQNFNTDLDSLGFFDEQQPMEYEAEITARKLARRFVCEMELHNAAAAASRNGLITRSALRIKRLAASYLLFRKKGGGGTDESEPSWTAATKRLGESLEWERELSYIDILRSHVIAFNRETETFGPGRYNKEDRQRYRTKKLKF